MNIVQVTFSLNVIIIIQTHSTYRYSDLLIIETRVALAFVFDLLVCIKDKSMHSDVRNVPF